MKICKKGVVLLVTVAIMMLLSVNAFAESASDIIKNGNLSNEYKEWLELPIEERVNTIAPRTYEIPKIYLESDNPLYEARFSSVGATALTNFDLRKIISGNVKVRDQGSVGACWSFGSLAALESHLGLSNYYSGKNTSKVYDFSEQHMRYGVTWKFKNNQYNAKGLNRSPNNGGRPNLFISYFTNGSGPIDETSMPYTEDKGLIELSQIQNKKTTAWISDIIEFPAYTSSDDHTEIIAVMKEHIKNNGAIGAGIHGATAFTGQPNYNIATGALYCSSNTLYPLDHYIAIVGWDDDYAIENFNEKSRPSKPGAWIIKNSWGESGPIGTVDEYKKVLYDQYTDICNQHGWYSYDKVPTEFLAQALNEGYSIKGDNVVVAVGDNGFMFVSYEDANIYSMLVGIEKASDSANYDNLYGYNEFYKIGFLLHQIK